MFSISDFEPFQRRREELDAQMAHPGFFADARLATERTREHQRLGRILDCAAQLRRLQADIHEQKGLVRSEQADPELRQLAVEELPQLEARHKQLMEDLLVMMVPPDPCDSRNTILEIRAGTGGDEAALFAGDLYRMYSRFAENRGWKSEMLSANPAELGGFKEICFLITGEDVYRWLKFESGVHRVQRVPETESGGRIHTSAATVAVLPEAEEVDVDIRSEDLEISVMRASGAGGQHVNRTESAVQIVHLPTNTTVYCADERSQLKNKQKALKVLYSRLLDRRQREEAAKYAANRKSQVGSGDRSERIRTYNFPQGRLTDHRINLTSYNLYGILEGDLEEILDSLNAVERQERMEEWLAGKGPAPK